MRIIGPPSAARDTALANAAARPGVHNRFLVEMFDPLWNAGLALGIDPVGVVAQAAKETGWGTFGGRVRPEFHNTCGLKNTPAQQRLFPGVSDGDNPLSHAMFASWDEGATAHVQHLCAYTGQPVNGLAVDPRYQVVVVLGRKPVETFEGLGGLWAPALDYGERLVEIARYLQGAA